jgi:hypothetical protein
MKITNLSIQNLFGVKHVSVDLKTPVTLFAGANGAGKSSIQNAVRLALTGQYSRVSLKKDAGQMIHEGAKKASVSVNAGGQCYGLDLPRGAAMHHDSPFLPLVLEPTAFAALSAQDRRKALFELMGVKVGADDVRKRAGRRQCDMELVEQVMPMLRNGFPAASEFAKNKASELRGEWKAATGETYGSQKADGWKPEPVEFDAQALAEKRDAATRLAAQIEKATQEVGELLALENQRAEAIERKKQLGEKCADINQRLMAMESAERHLSEQRAQLEKLEAKAAAPAHDPLACPHCGGAVAHQDGTLSAYDPPSVFDAQPDPQAGQNVMKHREALAMLQRTYNNRKQEFDTAKTAHDQLAAITVPDVDQGAVQIARGRIDALKHAQADLLVDVRALEELERKAKAAGETEAKAGKIHGQITSWLEIAEAFAPDGIPGELLSEAVGPINKRLQLHSVETKWQQIRITPDIDIEADGRPYHLLSESEKWRADAMLAECISYFSGLKCLFLDRFDVLSLPNRSMLIQWLDWLSADGDLETVLLFGTLKSCPTSNEVITAHWVEGGVITDQPDKKEKAA